MFEDLIKKEEENYKCIIAPAGFWKNCHYYEPCCSLGGTCFYYRSKGECAAEKNPSKELFDV